MDNNLMRTCVECGEALPADRFSKCNGYFRHQCKDCLAARARTKWREKKESSIPKFLTMLSEEEHKAIEENVGYWGRATQKEFHQLCNIRMGLQSWYRYVRLGDVQSYIDAILA